MLRFRRPALLLTAMMLWLLAAPRLLNAETVELPLFLRLQILQNALGQSLGIGTDGRAMLYQGDPYNYFHISKPVLSTAGGETSFTCRAAAGAGFKPIGGILPAGVEWHGSINLNLQFYLDPDWQLRFRVLDSAIYEEDGSQALVSGFIWNLAKEYLHPALEDFSFDLAVPRQEIITLLRTCVSAEETAMVGKTLATVRAGTLLVQSDGVLVPLMLAVPDRPASEVSPLKPQKPLNEDELEAFRQIYQPLDAFLVFVVKTMGTDFVSAGQREQLFELLITSRYQLLSILAGEVALDARDPLRILFADAWQQLKTIVEPNESSLMQDQLLRYMTLINAGDALLVLDAAAPQLGMHITTGGLRRLARMLNPDSPEDPLRFDWQIDPRLRDLFDFIPQDRDERGSLSGAIFLKGFLTGTAHAADTAADIPAGQPGRLDRWVPGPDELDDYGHLVSLLLEAKGKEQVAEAGLGSSSAGFYLRLVPATALIESCWRQYVRKDGSIEFVLSRSGSIGMMQINQHVWRGFFDINRLKWDAAYNIEAGTTILMNYYRDYGLEVAEKTGKPEDAARSAYSAYNAGPRGARRFMKKTATPREKQVDSRLWEYFQAISAGGSINLATCSVDRKEP